MPGTFEGGRKAQHTIVKKLGPEAAHKWRQQIGAAGGRLSSNSEWALSDEGNAKQMAAGMKAAISHKRRAAERKEQKLQAILEADLSEAEQVKEVIKLGFDAEVAEEIVTRYYAEQVK